MSKQTTLSESIGDACGRLNVIMVASTHWGRGAGRFDVGAALASGERPAGPLLAHIQAEQDLAMVQSMARALFRHMAQNGRKLTEADERGESATFKDAVGDGLLALAQWRAAGVVVPFASPSKRKRPTSEGAGVAWRAIVASVAHDNLGESIPLHTVGDDWLYHNADQRDETRAERAHRLVVDRLRAANVRAMDGILLDKLGKLKGASRWRRARALVRVRRAVRLMLAGERLEDAATRAGFKASGQGRSRASAGDRLLQAVRRICPHLGVVRRGIHATTKRKSEPRHVSSVTGTGERYGFTVAPDGVCAPVVDGGQVPGFRPLAADYLERQPRGR